MVSIFMVAYVPVVKLKNTRWDCTAGKGAGRTTMVQHKYVPVGMLRGCRRGRSGKRGAVKTGHNTDMQYTYAVQYTYVLHSTYAV
jgi:hypothetical protein